MTKQEAFLTEIKAVLEKYDARIVVDGGDCNTQLFTNFKDGSYICHWLEEISPEYIEQKQYQIKE